jgi:ribosomal protein S18 acetylase RimI-like enzyme
VLRRVLPGETGPTGGPAMTDVLGTCESWADGIVTVRREDGTLVEVRTAEIVAGKPVPPRPPTRLRVSTRQAESHAGPHWPGVLREALGEWEIRFEPEERDRLRKRANSCLAVGDPGVGLSEAAARIERYYRDRGRAPMVQVEVDSDADRWFTSEGWEVVPGGDSLFLLGSVARARRLLGDATGVPDGVTPRVEVDGPRVRAAVLRSGRELGVGHAAIDGDWLGVHDLRVEPTARRQGLARAVMTALLGWGAEQGATTLWLHVETDNAAARALYESMGLQVHHGCRYLSPGPVPAGHDDA